MKPTLLLYATREGHTAKIIAHLASKLEGLGVPTKVVDVNQLPAGFRLEDHGAAVLASPIHIGRHDAGLLAFAKGHRAALDAMGAGLLSVSLSQAGVDDGHRSEAARAKSRAEVQGTLGVFEAASGWKPAWVLPVAGALLYTRYNFFIRFVMKRISKANEGPTDTSRDHVLTRWEQLDTFAAEHAAMRHQRADDLRTRPAQAEA